MPRSILLISVCVSDRILENSNSLGGGEGHSKKVT